MTVMYWLVAAAVFVVIEIMTMGLTTIWFAGGALVGAVMAAVSLPLWSQIIAFAVISVILLILTRPWALKYVNSRTIKTNVDSLIGQTGLVTQDIDNLNAKGQVKVRGQIWTARSISDEVKLHEGQKVSIESISGVKVIGTIFMIIIILLVVYIVTSCVRIVPQAQAYVIERLGAYNGTWSVGMHFKVPFIDRVAKKVLLKEQVVDFAPQPVITKDNVTMRIDTVVYYQITDPKLYAYGVDNPIMAIENLTATTLRNIIGDLELDSTLTSRETINTKMRATLDEATDPWGIKVNRVELKNIIPPTEIQNAMEKQMKAERERREAILRAEGEKKSSILRAEGHKESTILEAEAEKEAAILNAEAKKEAMIREAEGQAEAILKVQTATADGLRAIREAGADEAVIKLKSLEALEKVADGKATKIIIPSEIQNLAGLVTSIKEVATQPDPVEEADTTEE